MPKLKHSLRWLGAAVLSGGAGWLQAQPLPQPPAPSPVALVDALNGVFGQHAGARASHAKGVCVQGQFVPDAEILKVTDGAFWRQKQVPVEGRFSIGGGNPRASDKGKGVRGLSLHIGQQWDLAAISAPVFFVATPQEFVGFMEARRPDPATGKTDAERIKAFNAATPSTQAQIAYLAQTPVPASYAQTAYWGGNAFVFQRGKGPAVHGRWRLEPQAGRVGLSDAELAQKGDDFLVPELEQRLAQGPVVFQMWLQLAQAGDDVNNPTVAWSPQNPQLRMGQVTLTRTGGSCEPSMFNPALLPKGMALSQDPILQVRAGAYGVSLGRRLAP